MKRVLIGGAVAALLVAVPAQASAEWILTPFIGSSFAGKTTNEDFEDVIDRQKMTYGGTFTWLGEGVLGFEADLGYSPEYFEADDDDLDFVDSSNVTTLMGNVVVSAPMNGFRPYATAGVGIIKTTVDDVDDFFDVNNNELGFNVGGGIMAFLSDRVGVRGDVRYFRAMNKQEDEFDFDITDFAFWRATVGASFRF